MGHTEETSPVNLIEKYMVMITNPRSHAGKVAPNHGGFLVSALSLPKWPAGWSAMVTVTLANKKRLVGQFGRSVGYSFNTSRAIVQEGQPQE